MSQQFVPRFKVGEHLTAEKMNALADTAGRFGTICQDEGEVFDNVLGKFRADNPPGAAKPLRVKITAETVNNTVTPAVRHWAGVVQRRNANWGVVNGTAYWEDTTRTITRIVPWDGATTLEVDEIVVATKMQGSSDWQALGNVC